MSALVMLGLSLAAATGTFMVGRYTQAGTKYEVAAAALAGLAVGLLLGKWSE